jgi:menaquinol-cytochrome c reductase iron-sulfur subunit
MQRANPETSSQDSGQDNLSEESKAQEIPSSIGPGLFNRRDFLTLLNLGIASLVGVIIGLPVIGVLVAPMLRKEPEVWESVGDESGFNIGDTVEVNFSDPSALPWTGVAAKTGAWLRRESQDQFRAFALNCTHLGCPVHWLQDAELFMCPCHGGVYYKDGNVAAGPPPRPLVTYPVRINNGKVEIRTSPTPITTIPYNQ